VSAIIPISIVLDFYTDASIEKVYQILADVPRSVGHFPNVEQLVELGEDKYRWEMEKMGSQNYYFQVKYTTRYTRSDKEKWIRWVPISEGNGEFSGCWMLYTEDGKTRVHFENEGHLQLPVPRFAKRLVKPFVSAKFQELFDIYIDNLQQTFSGLTT
jgi:carbon monoxide dehydrogenase subunit G